jgi:hypothetical protein
VRGYHAHQRDVDLAHGLMRARFEQCAGRVRAAYPHESDQLPLLRLTCAESLSDDRWLTVLAPNLWRDTAIAGAGPMGLALGLVLVSVLTSRFGASRGPKRKKVSA